MDLKWLASMLSEKPEFNNNHKIGLFARECRGHRTKITGTRKNQDNTRKNVNVEDTSAKQCASKSLDKLIESQIPENTRKSLGFVSYNVVPPPPIGLFLPPKLDLSNTGLEEFQQPKFEGYGPKTSKEKPVSVRREFSAPIIEDWELDSDEEDEPKVKVVRKTVKSKTVEKENVSKNARPSYAKIEFVRPKTARQVRQGTNSQSYKARANQRNWNNMISQRLGSNYEMIKKSCYECGSFNHLIRNCHKKKMVQKPVWNNTKRVNHQHSARMTHPNPKRKFVPSAVLTRSGKVSVNTAKQNLSKADLLILLSQDPK
ncbi:ribonuclease H-like domain-containing protein [Tanacetum coccineum]|uniref:Ribonuclease H-like domain-containing protein n=1 Tax=Tanacetum coccineum TaxID=301880 RepID=A0ABQ5EVV4_9ASTR